MGDRRSDLAVELFPVADGVEQLAVDVLRQLRPHLPPAERVDPEVVGGGARRAGPVVGDVRVRRLDDGATGDRLDRGFARGGTGCRHASKAPGRGFEGRAGTGKTTAGLTSRRHDEARWVFLESCKNSKKRSVS